MRDSLAQLISDTIIFEYSLPNNDKNIKNVHFSTSADECYSISDTDNLVKIIYNSILEYSYDETNWSTWYKDTTLSSGQTLYLRGDNPDGYCEMHEEPYGSGTMYIPYCHHFLLVNYESFLMHQKRHIYKRF